MRPRPLPIQPHNLPGILSDIARATSVDTALMIGQALGGHRISLPKFGFQDKNVLVALVGNEVATKIRDAIGHGVYKVPSGIVFRHYHDTLRLRADGLSQSAIARQIGISPRRVERLLASGRPPLSPGKKEPTP